MMVFHWLCYVPCAEFRQQFFIVERWIAALLEAAFAASVFGLVGKAVFMFCSIRRGCFGRGRFFGFRCLVPSNLDSGRSISNGGTSCQ